MKTATKTRAPIDCSCDQICKMRRDNVESGEFWCQTNGDQITIAHQVTGERPQASITIPRAAMKRFVKFLTTPQTVSGEGA